MRNLLNFLTTALLIFGMSFPMLIYGANATISGSVVDSQTKTPLPGANVFLAGTAIGAATTPDGRFSITNVPPGQYTLIINYIGYDPKREPITISATDQQLKFAVELEYAGLKFDKEIVVTAQREGQMEAINKQLAARQIVNVVASDRIQELPDANAAESVNRLPGVSVLREGGEGTKIVIRGLSPKYNAVMIEGVRLPSTDYGERSADLSMISPYMLEGIEVMKAITPDQDADVIGGTVDFKIKEAGEALGSKGNRFGFDLIARGGWNGLKNTYDDYKITGEVSTRLLKSRLGILAQVDIEKRNRSSHNMGASYFLKGPELGKDNPVFIGGLSLGDIIREKERLGATFVVDYRIPQGKISFKNILSRAQTNTQSYGETFDLGGNNHDYNVTDASNELNILTNILNYEQHFSRFKFDTHLSHSYSENGSPTNIWFRFHEKAAFYGNFDNKVHPREIPSFAKNSLNSTYLYDVGDNRDQAEDRQLTAAANLEMSFNLSRQINGKVKIGGKYRSADREYDHEAYGGLMWVGGAVTTRQKVLDAFPWMLESDLIVDKSSWFYYPVFLDHAYDPGNFLNGEYKMGPVTDINLMREMIKIIRTTNDIESYHQSAVGSTVNDYTGNEYLSAGYLMTDLNIGSKISIIPGVRFEQLKTSYSASQGDSRPRDADLRYKHTDTTVVKNHAHWLPMVHVRVKPLRWFDVRFAYTNTLSRPDFVSITPNYNISLGSVMWHNYQLKPLRSENFDLYFSLHQNHIGLFTIGGFFKNIRDMIYGTSDIIIDPAEYNLPDYTMNYEISTTKNNPYQATVKGIEIDWQTSFWYLPGLLRGLVFNTNYTHIFSKTQYPRTVIEVWYDDFWRAHKTYIHSFYSDRMLDQPDDILNAAIGYDYKDFSIRLSMLYQSNIFKGSDFWPELRRETDDYVRWDLSIKQDLPWQGLQLYCNMNNLNAALDVDLNQGSLYPVGEQHYGRTMDLGLRWRF
jgi:TonB-dependent receptor